MKRIKYGLLVVCANFALTAHAFAPVEPYTQVLAQNSLTTGSAPTDNTIRRINPNSRQGTTSSVPPVRGPSTLPIQPTPLARKWPDPQWLLTAHDTATDTQTHRAVVATTR